MPDFLLSIRIRIIIPMLLIIFLTGAFIALSFSNSETLQSLDRQFKNMLSNQLQSRRDDIDKQLDSVMNQADRAVPQIREEAMVLFSEMEISENGTYIIDQHQAEILNNLAGSIILDLAQLRGVNGAYIVWNASPVHNSQTKEGLHIKDFEPDLISPDKNDLQLIYGSALWAGSENIALASDWSRFWGLRYGDYVDSPAFNINKVNERIETIIMQANRSGNFSRLPVNYSFWTEKSKNTISDTEDNELKMVYTLPLLDNEGKVFALIGIEVSPELLLEQLPDIDPGFGSGSFFIGRLIDHDLLLLNYTLAKPTIQQIISPAFADNNDIIEANLIPVDDGTRNFYNLDIDVENIEKYIVTLQPIHSLSGNNNFDRSNQWIIAEMALESELARPSTEIFDRLIFVIFIALCLALLAALIIGTTLTKPVVLLASKMKGQGSELSDNAIKLPRFKIKEIDLLSGAIEQMNQNLIEASFKTAAIIDLVDLPIASFEEQPEKDIVIISSAMADLLDLEIRSDLHTSIALSTWNSLMNLLLSKPEKDFDSVYRWQKSPDHQVKWLRLRQAKNQGRVSGIIMEVSEEVLNNRRLIMERDYDDLTRLLNRAAFTRRVNELIRNNNQKYGLMIFIDLDNLKKINDNYGHQFGDQYLQMAADFISKFRKEKGLTSRFSGDEFAVFLGLCDSREEIIDQCNSVLSLIHEEVLYLPDQKSVTLQMSMGAAWYPDDSSLLSDLIEYADFAMYQRKRSGKDGLTWFNRQEYTFNQLKLQQKADLDEIIANNLLEYAAQPVISAKTAEIIAYDLMIRPLHERINLPLDLIRIAIEHQKLSQIEALMIKNASKWYQENISDNKKKNLKIFLHLFEGYSCRLAVEANVDSVNKSAKLQGEYTADSEPAKIDERLVGGLSFDRNAGFEDVFFPNLVGRIIFVVDSSDIVNSQIYKCCCKRCRKYKGKLALSGFDSLELNRHLFADSKPTYIRLNISLVRDIESDPHRQKLVETMIEYCKKRSIKTIAEGISTAGELETMITLGIDYIQGYYIGRPAIKSAEIKDEIKEQIKLINKNNNQIDFG